MADPQTRASFLEEARAVIEAESRAVLGLRNQLGGAFADVVQRVLACRGRVVVTGMGKSGLVGQKISATLASTGTPSLYLHAAEATHGDMGRITAQDIVVVLSNSGESEEIVRLIRPIKALGATLVAMTGDPGSNLARHADLCLCIGDVAEACPMGLVPTASTTAMMVLGDALAMCLFNHRGFGREEYARFHPGGPLGRKLMKVAEVMRADQENPVVTEQTSVRRALAVMTETPGRPGATSVVDEKGHIAGFFTDGDLRRWLEHADFSLDWSVCKVMHRNPKTVGPGQLVVEAARILRENKIDQVPVVDADSRVVGLLDVQDLLSSRVI